MADVGLNPRGCLKWRMSLQRVPSRFDWRLGDPFARGAYSYVAVGGVEAPAELGRPLGATLFFAGEATDGRGDSGTVHGAIESGWRAAREVAVAIGVRAPQPTS